jgi:arylsulfatase A-like enzyme
MSRHVAVPILQFAIPNLQFAMECAADCKLQIAKCKVQIDHLVEGWPFWIAFITLVLSVSSALRANDRPNLIVLVTDDQRFDTLGCLGNKIIQTPHLDALAKDGVVFENAFVTTSICAISRASIFSGQYARRHGIHNFAKPFAPDAWAKTYPMLLKKAGYRTGFIGKFGVGNVLPAEDFDYWAGFPGQGRFYAKTDTEFKRHLNRTMSEQALEFLAGCKAEQPFCLSISFKAGHAQDGEEWEYPHELRYKDLYADVTIPPPPTATPEHFARLPKFLQESEGRRRWQPRFSTPERYQRHVKDYYRLLTGMDAVVGDIVADLARRGLAESTVILFTADNGYYLGDYGLADKWFMHEPSIRVPMLLYDPRLPAQRRGQRVKQMALNIDVAPTLLELAGIDVPLAMQGRSLVPLAQGQPAEWRIDFFYEHPFNHALIPKSEGVRTERWKYVRYVEQDPPVEELYDLKNDPLEQRNLTSVSVFGGQLDVLRNRFEQFRRELE